MVLQCHVLGIKAMWCDSYTGFLWFYFYDNLDVNADKINYMYSCLECEANSNEVV